MSTLVGMYESRDRYGKTATFVRVVGDDDGPLASIAEAYFITARGGAQIQRVGFYWLKPQGLAMRTYAPKYGREARLNKGCPVEFIACAHCRRPLQIKKRGTPQWCNASCRDARRVFGAL